MLCSFVRHRLLEGGGHGGQKVKKERKRMLNGMVK